MFEKVLFPTDLSEYALKVLDYLDQIPGIREVVQFHVIILTPSYPPSLGPQIIYSILDEAEARLNEQKAYLEESGLKAKIIRGLVKRDHIGCLGILKLCPETDMLEGIALAEVIQRAADIEEVSLVTMELWARALSRADPLADHRPRFLKGAGWIF